jgi:D-arabinose 1-dehydrogenase-like Zn-dependent alcohol dehydrogenase
MTLPKTCRAAVVSDFGVPVEIQDLPMPEQLEPGALLVRVDVATVCGSDLHLIDGSIRGTMSVELPVVLGHEMTGTIVEMGPGTDRDSIGTPLAAGDRLVWTHESCGSCYECSVLEEPRLCRRRRSYEYTRCTDFPYLVGAFAEYCYVFPRSERLRVPDEVKPEWASAASCALRTVMHVFDRLGAISPGQVVAIQGTGPLGLFAVAVACARDAREVIAIGAPEQRLRLAREWGATATVSVADLDADERVEAVLALTGGDGADVVLELSGASGAFGEGLRMARTGARYVVAGPVGSDQEPVQPSLVARKQLDIRGAWAARIADYWHALEFMRQQRERIDFDAMLGNTYPLDAVNDALTSARSGVEGKAVIRPHMGGSGEG